MRVLVTGATGFVGEHLCRELSEKGHKVLPLSLLGENATHRCDITDASALSELCQNLKPDAAIHLAGIAKTNLSVQDIGSVAAINVSGTLNVCSALEKSGCKILLYISSGLVYGGRDIGRAFVESDDIAPPHIYAQSKVAAESIVRLFGWESRLMTYIVRPFNHIGPNQSRDFVVAALAERVRNAEDSGEVITGDLSSFRDFVDVRDVVRAYRLIIEKLPMERLFVLGSGKTVKIEFILEQLIEISGKKLRHKVDSGLLRANDPSKICGNASLAQKVLGWAPGISLRKSLEDVYAQI